MIRVCIDHKYTYYEGGNLNYRVAAPDLSGRATNAGRSLQPYYGVVARLTNRDLGLHRIRVPGDAALSELE